MGDHKAAFGHRPCDRSCFEEEPALVLILRRQTGLQLRTFTYVPVRSDFKLTDSRSYSVQTTKPFCDTTTPIQITGGPLTFALRI